jgi:ABC-type multidrug transport system ATPase subunit
MRTSTGKTTTLRMLLGLVTPTSGMARIGGRPYQKLACPLRQVGVALESAGAHPGRTARGHLRLQAMLAGVTPGAVGPGYGAESSARSSQLFPASFSCWPVAAQVASSLSPSWEGVPGSAV